MRHSMTINAAVIAVVVSAAAGYYWRKSRVAEQDRVGAAVKARAAARVAWQARRHAVAAGLVVLVAVDMWVRGKGR